MAKGKISRDFYCSAGLYKAGNCTECICGCQTCKIDCKNYHRKHPTPEQFKEEYGEEYPFDGAVYGFNNGIGAWMIYDLFDAKRYSNIKPIVCACTPYGKPDNDWRPE